MLSELGAEVEIVSVVRNSDEYFQVDYRTEVTGNFMFSLMVKASDELEAYRNFPSTLEYWNTNAVLPPEQLTYRKYKK